MLDSEPYLFNSDAYRLLMRANYGSNDSLRFDATSRKGASMKSSSNRCIYGLVLVSVSLLAFPGSGSAQQPGGRIQNGFLRERPFLQIPGPNPILIPGPSGSWDSHVIEAGDAFKDFGTYYLYYHATGGAGYQTGVATSKHPLGPFTKVGDQPILRLGPEGSWDARHAACAMILKEGTDRYLMWYSGYGETDEHEQWGVGLASAPSPAGPWKKHADNPLIKHFGYVGGVVKVNGKYHLFAAHPVGSTGDDYSPTALATADHPEGPWHEYPHNPVMRQGEWNEWDAGGISEAEVVYHEGLFHMFYGGARLYSPRILTRESIGYAYSRDGINWTKYSGNPVATREAEPNAAAYAEVHTIVEPPFIYLYHTLRYKQPWRDRFRDQFPTVEDLGVQVLVMQRPFQLDIPVLNRDTLAAGATTSMRRDESPIIALSYASTASVTVTCTYDANAQSGVMLHVRSSPDGKDFDTVDLHTWEPRVMPGETVRQTFTFEPSVKFIKLLVQNLDDKNDVSDLKVVATLGG